jgi:hypothetical protein
MHLVDPPLARHVEDGLNPFHLLHGHGSQLDLPFSSVLLTQTMNGLSA